MDELTELQKEKALKIIAEDKGFHTVSMQSAYPFSPMLNEDGDGYNIVYRNCSVTIESGAYSVFITFSYSVDLDTWFFSAEWNGDKFDGIVHFNTLYNAGGEIAFAFLNDSDDDTSDSITRNLPYSGFLFLAK